MGRPGKKTAYQGRATQILILLSDQGPLNTSKLVDLVGIQQKAISGYLKPLRDEGFISSQRARLKHRAEDVLERLSREEFLTSSDLERLMRVPMTNVARYVSEYRKQGFLESDVATYDKRVLHHRLTSDGRKYLDDLNSGLSVPLRGTREVFHTLTTKGREHLDSLNDHNVAPEVKSYTSLEIDKEFGQSKRGESDISLDEWKKKRADDLLQKAAALREKEEQGNKNSSTLKENDDGSFSF